MLYWILDKRKFLKTLKKSFSEPISEDKKEDFQNQPSFRSKLNTIFSETELKNKWLSLGLRDILLDEGYIKIGGASLSNYKNAGGLPTHAHPAYKKYEIISKWEDLLNISHGKYIEYIVKEYPWLTWISLTFILWAFSSYESIINFLKSLVKLLTN